MQTGSFKERVTAALRSRIDSEVPDPHRATSNSVVWVGADGQNYCVTYRPEHGWLWNFPDYTFHSCPDQLPDGLEFYLGLAQVWKRGHYVQRTKDRCNDILKRMRLSSYAAHAQELQRGVEALIKLQDTDAARAIADEASAVRMNER